MGQVLALDALLSAQRVWRGQPVAPARTAQPTGHASLDALLRAFVEQRRMKIAGDYRPCYRVVG